MCVHGNLFIDTVSKIQMMQKMATSLNEHFHLLLPDCLNEWLSKDISIDEVKRIVLSWFSNALKYHFKTKSKSSKTSTSLQKLYFYVGKISSHPLVRSESDLRKDLDRKAFEYLKEFEIIHIVNVVPEMAKLENGPTEDMLIDHIR